MKRYVVKPANPNHEIRVGWDPQAGTYFVHVTDITKDEDDPEYDVYMIGFTWNELTNLDVVIAGLQKYAKVITGDLIRKLYADANPPAR